jgi:hypothetical protein
MASGLSIFRRGRAYRCADVAGGESRLILFRGQPPVGRLTTYQVTRKMLELEHVGPNVR